MKFADLTDLFLFLFSVACARHVSFVPNSWVMRSLPRASAEAAVDMPMYGTRPHTHRSPLPAHVPTGDLRPAPAESVRSESSGTCQPLHPLAPAPAEQGFSPKTPPTWGPRPTFLAPPDAWSVSVNTPNGVVTLYGALTEDMTRAYPFATWQSEKQCDSQDTTSLIHITMSLLAFAERVRPEIADSPESRVTDAEDVLHRLHILSESDTIYILACDIWHGRRYSPEYATTDPHADPAPHEPRTYAYTCGPTPQPVHELELLQRRH
jgi:hypothetical protein